MPRHELFLSHASPNRRFVERLAKWLDTRTIRYFYSKRHIAGARQWHDELGVALNRCNWFVIVLSKKSVKSVWVKRELLFALQSSQYKQRIVPILLESCAAQRLSWTLPSFQYVDFRHGFEQGCDRLLEALGPAAKNRAVPRWFKLEPAPRGPELKTHIATCAWYLGKSHGKESLEVRAARASYLRAAFSS